MSAQVIWPALGAFGVYVLTLCPTVYVEGSGELLGAAHFLGTAHPTGYPLFCLVGRLFSALLPLANTAYKINLASACTGALAVGGLAWLLRGQGLHPFIAAAGALAFGFSGTFWSQVVIAEVYGLSTLMAFLVMSMGLRAAQGRGERELLLMAWLMGLGLSAHLSQVLLWPGLALLLAWRWRGLWQRPALLGKAALAGLGGYSLVLYLPLRSGQGTGFHWGPLDRADLVWDHLSGALYRSSFFSLPWEGLLLNAGRWTEQAMAEFHPLLLPLMAWGVYCAWKRDRPGLLVAGGALLANLLAALNYHRDPHGLGVFFLLSFAVLGIFLGYALDDVGKSLERLAGRWARVVVGGTVVLALLGEHLAEADRSGNWISYKYGRDILDDLPAGAVLITEADDASFTLDYLWRVEGLRPDVSLYNRVGRGTDLLTPAEQQLPPGVQARLRRQREAVLARGERPLYYLVARQAPEGYQFSPEGLVYRLWPAGKALVRPSRAVEMDNALQEGFYRDPWARKIQSNYWFMEGERHRAAGRQEEAIAAYERAAELAFDSRTARYNVALMLFRYNKLDQAMAHVQAAWRLDPWQRAPQQLMALIRQQQEQMQEPGSLLKGAEVTDGFP